MSEYLVSVIVPIYNVSEYIEKCAIQLFSQTYDKLEYIFVDDCSPDNSLEILNKIILDFPLRKNKVKIITHNQNKGLAAARNTGLNVAKGEYIFHCDSDDWLETNGIEEMVNKIVSEKADILYCNFYYTYNSYNKLAIQAEVKTGETYIKNMFIEKLHGAVWNKLYKKSLFTDHFIQFPNGNDMWEDLYTNFYLFYYSKKISYLNKAYYHYNQENVNSLVKGISIKKLQEIILNVVKIEKFLNKQKDKRFIEQIQILKLASKQTLLFTTQIDSFKKWNDIFPEVNHKIIKFKSLPFHLRLVGFCAANRYWNIIKLWVQLKLLLKKNK